MKFVTFEHDGRQSAGVLSNDGRSVFDLAALVPDLGGSVLAVVDAGAGGLVRIGEALAMAKGGLPLSAVRLKAPIPMPRRNIMCVGKNYYEHAKEFHDSGFDASAGKDAIPERPIFFSKSFSTVIGPGDAIDATSDWTGSVDYEVELAVVIGRRARSVAKAEAYGYVFGYTIINDVTSRTLQHAHKQWFLGKNFDTFCPMGPALVTADEIGDVTTLEVTSHVNGEPRQQALVKDLIFDIPMLIATLSAVMTLEPGDIIATGTPAGVGIGFVPPRYMMAGDVVRCSISRIGTLENPVI